MPFKLERFANIIDACRLIQVPLSSLGIVLTNSSSPHASWLVRHCIWQAIGSSKLKLLSSQSVERRTTILALGMRALGLLVALPFQILSGNI